MSIGGEKKVINKRFKQEDNMVEGFLLEIILSQIKDLFLFLEYTNGRFLSHYEDNVRNPVV